MSETAHSKEISAETVEIEVLFVQSAHSMTYADGRLVLENVVPTTIIFSDRPDRFTGHLPVKDFIESWGDGDNSFAEDPPNAVLSIFSGDSVTDAVIVLSKPELKNADMHFSVDILDGELPESGGPVSLFIDTVGRPLSPVSVAGVHRRNRRRSR